MDLGLPDLDGVEVITRIRAWSNAPIIVISARSEDSGQNRRSGCRRRRLSDKALFSVEELLARLRVAHAPRAGSDGGHAGGARRLRCLSTASLRDRLCGWLRLSGKAQELHLTPIEYKLLCLLAQNVGKVLTHTYVTRKIWGNSMESDIASLRVFMATLRKKLEKGGGTQYIQTHIGVGYRMLRVESIEENS